MSLQNPPLGLLERVGLLDRSGMAPQCIDPEELHFTQPGGNALGLDTSTPSCLSQSFSRWTTSNHPNSTLNPTSNSTSSTKLKWLCDLDYTACDYEKVYNPRQPSTGIKTTRKGLRVKPKNGQHARELERNRNAAASYRSRQKNQLDSLLTRVREEEQQLIKQKNMVYSLEDELWHLRNELYRQQLQVLGTTKLDAAG